ncbi:MAG: SDR family oxidoreductase [Bdellovibrionaceae bacterium]|nr:SDR family oxidoreductase [Pseudobdellovibrionaceae bacterium]
MLKKWLYVLFFRRQTQKFKPVILVTGCASGIGLALAHALHKLTQYRVIATAREGSLHLLREHFTEDARFWIRPLDVTSASDRENLILEINRKWGGVNILINNAGVSFRAVVEHMSNEDEERQMAVNYFGPMALIRLILPTMRDCGRGKIINISSVSGMLAMPTMASYSASKYALEGACESLWYETKPFGIDVCLIQPGFIRSSSFEKVAYTEKSNPEKWNRSAYADYYKNMVPFVAKMMGHSFTTPEDIAKTVVRTIQEPDPPLWIPATVDAWMFYYLRRLMPRRLLMPFLFYCLPNARHWAKRSTHSRRLTLKQIFKRQSP